MKALKKHIALSISALLLLCFSVTVLPLDLLHNHTSENTSRCLNTSNGTNCSHKYHVSQKTKLCWLCAIHYDKTFIQQAKVDNTSISAIPALFNDNEITAYFIKLIFTSLRGPPSE